MNTSNLPKPPIAPNSPTFFAGSGSKPVSGSQVGIPTTPTPAIPTARTLPVIPAMLVQAPIDGKIVALNDAAFRLIRADFNKVLQELGEKHGINYKQRSITYDTASGTFSFKLEAFLLEAVGGKTKENSDTAKLAQLGLPMGGKILLKGNYYLISGYNKSRPKFAVAITDMYGKACGATTVDSAKRCLVK